jgi:hypothetical protein
MNFYRRYAIPLNVLVIAVTIVFVGAALVVGRAAPEPAITLTVGEPSPLTFEATSFIEVPDALATEDARAQAAAAVKSEYKTDSTIAISVQGALEGFFFSLENQAYEEPPVTSATIPVETTSSTDAPTTSTEATTTSGSDIGSTTTGTAGETTTTVPETTTSTTTTTLPRVPIEDQVSRLTDQSPAFGDAIPVFVNLYNLNLDRVEQGESGFWTELKQKVSDIADEKLSDGIRSTDLVDVRNGLIQSPPSIFVIGLDSEQRTQLQKAAAVLVAGVLQANEKIDDAATVEARQAASDAVQEKNAQFFQGQQIAAEGDILTQVQIDAINKLGLIEPAKGTSRKAIVLLGALTVGLTAFFLWRLSPGRWSEPKHFALLGILVVLAALASRVPELVDGTDGNFAALGFAVPAMLFGYVAAILYDPRTAVILAIPVTTFVGISTADPAITVFAAGATVAPVAFVSSVSSRRELRVAVAMSAMVLAPLAFAISWVFRGWDTRWEAAFFALIGGVTAGLIAQSLVSFFENLFRMTTTLTLLDLVDRNHPALRLIEEKAPGTFNHSILVGTLAGKAARAIDADPLLAQAAAFYHDLGKVEDPIYFIENQFSITNPHDHLDPVDSCRIIRSHVTDGLRLARQYRLPPEIAEGIRCHHGTGLMRYFYHQAIEADPDADAQLFRHHGEKPKRKEMAILMICDAVEAAARAHAQQQDPTVESISKVVDAVVGEKLDDHQLDESALTFGDLTKVKAAIVEALVGYYHTRVPYPGFPGPPVEQQA